MKAYNVATALPVTPLSIKTLNALVVIHNQCQPSFPEQPRLHSEYNVMFYNTVEAGDEYGAIEEAERLALEKLKLPPCNRLVLLEDEIDFDSVADEVPHDPAEWMLTQGVRPPFPEFVQEQP